MGTGFAASEMSEADQLSFGSPDAPHVTFGCSEERVFVLISWSAFASRELLQEDQSNGEIVTQIGVGARLPLCRNQKMRHDSLYP